MLFRTIAEKFLNALRVLSIYMILLIIRSSANYDLSIIIRADLVTLFVRYTLVDTQKPTS